MSTKIKEIEAAYAEGASDVEIAALLGLTTAKFYQLLEEQPAFAMIVEKGRTLAHAWYMGVGRKNLWNKEFNTALYNFQMKNRYGWADKVDTTDSTNKDPVNLDQMKSELSSALKKLAKTSPELLSTSNLGVKSDDK